MTQTVFTMITIKRGSYEIVWSLGKKKDNDFDWMTLKIEPLTCGSGRRGSLLRWGWWFWYRYVGWDLSSWALLGMLYYNYRVDLKTCINRFTLRAKFIVFFFLFGKATNILSVFWSHTRKFSIERITKETRLYIQTHIASDDKIVKA